MQHCVDFVYYLDLLVQCGVPAAAENMQPTPLSVETHKVWGIQTIELMTASKTFEDIIATII